MSSGYATRVLAYLATKYATRVLVIDLCRMFYLCFRWRRLLEAVMQVCWSLDLPEAQCRILCTLIVVK